MVLDEWNNNLRSLLLKHEGLRLKPYTDTMGKLTIGVGRNLNDVGISQLEAMVLLSNDIARVIQEASTFAWFTSISHQRQDVIVCMIFNLGLAGFKQFTNMIAAVAAGNFNKAADEMCSSHWCEQVGERAKELAMIMRKGSY